MKCGRWQSYLKCGSGQRIGQISHSHVHFGWRAWFLRWWAPHWYSHHGCANTAYDRVKGCKGKHFCWLSTDTVFIKRDALRSSTRVREMEAYSSLRKTLREVQPPVHPASSLSLITQDNTVCNMNV